MSRPNVRVVNQLGEGRCKVVADTTVTAAGDGKSFNVFKIVADAVFTDITTTMVDGVAGLESPVSFAAGTEWVIPGVTSFELASGSVIAYWKV